MHALKLAYFAVLVSSTVAVPQTFFGEDFGPSRVNLTGPLLGSWPNSDQAHSNFVSKLLESHVEGFESFANNTLPPLDLTFTKFFKAGDPAKLTTDLGESDGRVTNLFPIYGARAFWTFGNFSVTFPASKPVTAFGVYGNDIGTLSGQLEITTINGATHVYDVPNTTPGAINGVCFWGVISDIDDPIEVVKFGKTVEFDGFVFDNLVVGTTVPPPDCHLHKRDRKRPTPPDGNVVCDCPTRKRHCKTLCLKPEIALKWISLEKRGSVDWGQCVKPDHKCRWDHPRRHRNWPWQDRYHHHDH